MELKLTQTISAKAIQEASPGSASGLAGWDLQPPPSGNYRWRSGA
jgi:hypothetical protein